VLPGGSICNSATLASDALLPLLLLLLLLLL
jgi:hypothetical protein